MIKKSVVDKMIKDDDNFGEKCGVIGVWCKDEIAEYFVRRGLSALQHRGQESAGISLFSEKGEIKTYKGMGLVPNVLSEKILKSIGSSKIAIGHNRYSTTGSSSEKNAQPFTLEKGKYKLSIGHNGNIPNCEYLGESIDGISKEDITSDTYLVGRLLLEERDKYKSWDEAIKNVLSKVHGAFCFVILTSDGTLYGARDPYGIRPMALGKIEDGWIMASESIALDLTGSEFMRDVKPGEVIKISDDGEISSFFFGEPKRPQHCLFEYIYFSRPDSFENGFRVRAAREEAGRLLGMRILSKKIEADAVVPVYDSGYPAAKGAAKTLGLPIIDAITVSHYAGRTFIQPGQENRRAAVNGKLNIVPDEVTGKNIIVVDDSVIRLTTSKMLIRGLRASGAKNIYMASASPPVVNHCDMGIDMKSKKELPASRWEDESFEVIEENVGKFVGADGMIYLPIDEISKAIGGVKEDFYHFPFGGPHPIRGKQYKFPKMKRRIKGKVKIVVFISGNGSNLQKIIDDIKNGEMDGEIVGVISNKTGAYGIERAKKNKIKTIVLPFSGKRNDKETRFEYDKKIISEVKKLKADLIVLAGWMLVLGDNFLTEAEKSEIPVINLHPALLTDKLEDHINTSRGRMPVIRGASAIKDAFNRKLLVSGVSVHQVISKNHVDMGPVILKEEVRRKMNDKIDEFESRIHEVERRTLPTAIKRVIHVMKSGINICTGEFYW